jgi:hypothetical protein
MQKHRLRPSVRRRNGSEPLQGKSRKVKAKGGERRGRKGPRRSGGSGRPPSGSRASQSVSLTLRETARAIAALLFVGFAIFETGRLLISAIASFGLSGVIFPLAGITVTVVDYAAHIVRACATLRLACGIALFVIGGAVAYAGAKLTSRSKTLHNLEIWIKKLSDRLFGR